jgi:hypothetical protein
MGQKKLEAHTRQLHTLGSLFEKVGSSINALRGAIVLDFARKIK